MFEKNDEAIVAYETGRCDALSSDQSGLYAARSKFKHPEDHIILPELISKEPLGPAIRHGDNQWADIARWVLFAWFEAEELGVTSINVDSKKLDPTPSLKRFLGLQGDTGKDLGLDATWAYHIVKQVGNYAEVFERNLGQNSPLKIKRGQNALWRDGGLHYPMPLR